MTERRNDLESSATVTWAARAASAPGEESRVALPVKTGPADDKCGFTPRPAIALPGGFRPLSETEPVVHMRLRELPLVYILMVMGSIFWRRAVLGTDYPTFLSVNLLDALVIVTLLGLVAVLWMVPRIPLWWLKAIELGMIAVIAARVATVQYYLMLEYSLRDDPMMAQLTMKNVVLFCTILILTYALYVPKSWRRAALVTVPLACMPFAVMLLLMLRYPAAMEWLERGWKWSGTPRIRLFGFDALMLAIVCVCATFGAHTMSRLRRQVAQARELGQYRLCRPLGSGGMGEVHLAEHQLLKRPCAIKLIRPGAASDSRALDRFEREVVLTAKLSHPNTVEIYDYGRSEDGTYYYVMELLQGLNLADLLTRERTLAPGRVVHLLRQVCGALGEAHGCGLIHRDIKPSNIFAARRGGIDDFAKLLDFGLVRPAIVTGPSHVSEDGDIIGTPLYMSPEQAAGQLELDGRADIYSLGAVAYCLLTGRPPFPGGGKVSVLIAHARDPVVPPSKVNPAVPDDLEGVVLRCLEKDRERRFQCASSLERALGDCGCAGDWDRDRAGEWWRMYDQAQEMTTPSPAVATT
jgi:serine/threonine-protein kinase